ncbi:spore germination protein [Bacillus alkalicellulosilyticus]|uniref:spore germination protein n=1 Tax=Alkalihalobacterium alkalicellulosilyticum TaxID=1912214 RepID=UPI0009979446|nr:spore germination protein [Bacillus alkalicellulosilyticus]
MAHVNNIVGIRINNASNNASINFGHSVHKGHQANVKMYVGYYQAGDANFSPLQFNNANVVNDNDYKDQTQAQV